MFVVQHFRRLETSKAYSRIFFDCSPRNRCGTEPAEEDFHVSFPVLSVGRWLNIMTLFPFLFQSAFLATQVPEAMRYAAAISDVRATQERLLLDTLRRNQDTLFGKRYHFHTIRSIQEYRRHVPVSGYQDFTPYLDRIHQGESNVLTAGPVRYLLPTGGTSGTKLIPYTAALHREFQRGLAPWLADIARSFPQILPGKTYWSVTPPGHRLKTLRAQAVPIGFEDDSAYLGWKGALLGNIFAVPSWMTSVRSMENFRFLTLYFLLREENLRWVSIWSPTYFLVLLHELETHAEGLLAALRDGAPTLPEAEPLPGPITSRRLPKRAAQLARVFALAPEEQYARIWPKLRFFSLWRDAYARHPADQLQRYFPSAVFQGKGLLATEAVMTFPLHAAGGCVPAITSHFLEFLDSHEQAYSVWELEHGVTYSVVLTTGGGFYRYAIGDLVKVSHHYRRLPVLEFLGRSERFSDLVGEKLDERFVTDAITHVREHSDAAFRFAFLAPERGEHSQGYALFLESPAPDDRLRAAGLMLDHKLQHNMQYLVARQLGQLQPVRVFRIRRGGPAAYLRRCVDDGQQLGDIKPLVFDTRNGWSDWFEGEWLPT